MRLNKSKYYITTEFMKCNISNPSHWGCLGFQAQVPLLRLYVQADISPYPQPTVSSACSSPHLTTTHSSSQLTKWHTLYFLLNIILAQTAGQTLKTTSQRYWIHICHHLARSEKPSGTAGSDPENNSRTKLLTAFSRLTKPRAALYKLDLGKRLH